ncbi:circumsporozoite protein-like [Patiria miniata]|uniref:Uncharacterized protein n=1 Tax=Patiria miniata TaxID=46514 RepID=A0A914BF20_PATMI|nr:circumsporozoite protein-like [Patiria miniata]
MKWLFVVAVIVGCLARLDASRIVRRADSSGEGNTGGTALTGFFAANDGSNGVDGALEAAGETIGVVGGASRNNDGGGDTPDSPDSPDNSPNAAAAGGGGNEVGDTPDGIDDIDSPDQAGGFGRPIVVNNGGQATVVDDRGEQSTDPEQMVGASSNVGTTAGIVVGVVALVGVAAGVAVYVIKKRN